MNFSKKVIVLTSMIIGGALLIGGAYMIRKAQKKKLHKKNISGRRMFLGCRSILLKTPWSRKYFSRLCKWKHAAPDLQKRINRKNRLC